MHPQKTDLVSLAQKGSLKRFSECLSGQPHAERELFSALRTALLWNQAQKAALLIDAGADPLMRNAEEDQLLTHAAIGGNPDLVSLMLSLGCDPNHRNANGRSALHGAARSGKLEAIRVLLTQGADIDCCDLAGRTPLTEALSNRHYPVAAILVESGADLDIRVQPLDRTPLMMAASGNSSELVRLMLDNGGRLEDRDANGCTPLMYAARAGRLQIVQILTGAGADLKAKDKNGHDALQWASPLAPEITSYLVDLQAMSSSDATDALLKAAGEGHAEMITTLMDLGARIQPPDEGGKSALVSAVIGGSDEAVNVLVDHPSVNVDYRSEKMLRTALSMAAGMGRASAVALLIDAGADLGVEDERGMTAIQHAAAASQLDIIKLLHAAGADLFSLDWRQRNLLHLTIDDSGSSAGASARTDTVKWLLELGLAPGDPDQSGLTPLMLAANAAREDIVRLLIDSDAPLDAADQKGRTALYHAICYGTDYGYNDRYVRPKSKKDDPAAPVIEILLASGADPNKGDMLTPAAMWRWPGARAMLRRGGAEGTPL